MLNQRIGHVRGQVVWFHLAKKRLETYYPTPEVNKDKYIVAFDDI